MTLVLKKLETALLARRLRNFHTAVFQKMGLENCQSNHSRNVQRKYFQRSKGRRFINNPPRTQMDNSYQALKQIVLNRYSSRDFDPARSIDVEDLKDMLTLAQRAPTSFNTQPYACVVVRDEERMKLSTAMVEGNSLRVRNAPVTVVFLSDLEPTKRINRIADLEMQAGSSASMVSQLPFGITFVGGEGAVAHRLKSIVCSLLSPLRPMPTISSPEAWAYKQTMGFVQTFILTCAARGLDTAPMEGFDQERIRSILSIPPRYSIPVVVSVGYGTGRSRNSPRLPASEVIFDSSFGKPL